MTWTAPRTWVVGEILTGALLNTHLRDNLLETAAAAAAAAGDLIYADAANSMGGRAAIGTSGQVAKVNAAGTGYTFGGAGVEHKNVISLFSPECLGVELSLCDFQTAAHPSASRAIFVPFYVYTSVTAKQIAVEIGTSSGNIDVGIYNSAGAKQVSLGSTASPGTGRQLLNIGDTVLTPGLYFFAIAADNTTITWISAAKQDASTVMDAANLGVRQMAAAFPLPSSVTYAAMATDNIPDFSISIDGL